MKKAWLALVALTVAGSIGTACTITTTDDDTDGGASSFGGSSSGGASTSGGATAKGGTSAVAGGGAGGSASGGKAGSGGSATGGGTGEPQVVCDRQDNPSGTPAPKCVFASEDSTPCHECLTKTADCCAAVKQCFGTNPENQCAYGGPDGESEFACIESCIRAKVIKNGTYTDAEVETCAADCVTPKCSLIGDATNVMLSCMLNECEAECFAP